ncbi:hypothetical protein EJ05DRAFT_487199 [Pseudovirgaria hyperparasitica]|uniref:Uncharacterized protein n=1 Tax=Pseudovirgaria hyperparasitica TaxID=470096 RepID=A0A6A6W4Y6_9PEZI|nr:uncharacterized protein EJ05DRAFT_487199 [Pseudovirgaria hyperparasitica]KAF2757239.1 hypothetical protein EJ05DRAFT_487199 [Pseudovirgaria hyperparasitica]
MLVIRRNDTYSRMLWTQKPTIPTIFSGSNCHHHFSQSLSIIHLHRNSTPSLYLSNIVPSIPIDDFTCYGLTLDSSDKHLKHFEEMHGVTQVSGRPRTSMSSRYSPLHDPSAIKNAFPKFHDPQLVPLSAFTATETASSLCEYYDKQPPSFNITWHWRCHMCSQINNPVSLCPRCDHDYVGCKSCSRVFFRPCSPILCQEHGFFASTDGLSLMIGSNAPARQHDEAGCRRSNRIKFEESTHNEIEKVRSESQTVPFPAPATRRRIDKTPSKHRMKASIRRIVDKIRGFKEKFHERNANKNGGDTALWKLRVRYQGSPF